jgi:DNA end-binding protein Ku
VVIRTREYLSAMFVRDDVMVLMLLRFPQEIKAVSKLELPSSKDKEWHPVKREMELAERLIDEMSTKWDPKDFHDEYRAALMDYIDKKISKGDTVDDVKKAADDEEMPKGKVVDLAEYLERSVGQKKSTGKQPAAKKAAKKAAKHAKKAVTKKTARKKARSA